MYIAAAVCDSTSGGGQQYAEQEQQAKQPVFFPLANQRHTEQLYMPGWWLRLALCGAECSTRVYLRWPKDFSCKLGRCQAHVKHTASVGEGCSPIVGKWVLKPNRCR
jgi:hypothetical protein